MLRHGAGGHRRQAVGGGDQAQSQGRQPLVFERNRDQPPAGQLLGEAQAGVERDAGAPQQEALQDRQGVRDHQRLVRALEGVHLGSEEGLHRAGMVLVEKAEDAALVQGDGRARRKLMIGGHDGAHRTRNVGEQADAAAPGRREGETEVRVALGDGVHGLDGVQGHDPDLDGRMGGDEPGHRLGQEVHGQAVEGGDGHLAADDAAQVVDVPAQPGEVVQGVPRVAQNELPGVGQPHAVRVPLEQRGAEVVLELQYLPVDGGRRDVQPFRGAADRPFLRHRLEVPQHRRMHPVSASVRPPTGHDR